MTKRIPIGVADYKELKTGNFYSVDKSLMIKDFLDRKTKVTLITRPRRFGKTINMSMMAEFFDITKQSKDIFQNTDIMNTEYSSEMNQYPTVFISFADAKQSKYNIVKTIKLLIRKEYDRYDHIFQDHMSKFDQNEYQNIVNGLMDIDDESFDNVSNALSFLMERLEKYYAKKVMVFIDEYDTPFIEAHINDFYEEIRDGLVSLLHRSLKSSTSLACAMLTGIQRVAKENIFSDLNNFVVCTVKDSEYSQYFGFTEKETKEVLKYYGLKLNDEVEKMYDGYRFGAFEIYNPWSILNYCSRKSLEPYWVNTSGNRMIRKAMENSEHSFNQGYEALIQNGKIETLVHMDTSFYEVNSTASLWGLLVNAGYLTILEVVSTIRERYILRIPNQEVAREFQNLTAYYLNVSDTSLTDLFDALLDEEKESFMCYYRNMLLTLPSYHDLKDENSYHVLFLGMCAWLSNDYEVISNREEGKGRCDIILKARNCSDCSYIFEFKYVDANGDVSDEKLTESAKTAVRQIADRKYDAGINGRVIYIGLAHHGKDAAMEWIEK